MPVSISIYDIAGRVQKSYMLPALNQCLPIEIFRRGDNEHGDQVPSGVYFVRVDNGLAEQAEKVLIVR